MRIGQQLEQLRKDSQMDKRFIYAIFWFFAVAPFMTAVPLFFLMPESLPARVYPFALLERQGSRWELFLVPASWLIVDIAIHFVFRLIERTSEKISNQMILLRLLSAVIFCGLAIIMELIIYKNAMINL